MTKLQLFLIYRGLTLIPKFEGLLYIVNPAITESKALSRGSTNLF